jgi:hypothetical protein
MGNPESVCSRDSYSRINDSTILKEVHNILRKTTNDSGLPGKNRPKSPTRVQERDSSSSGFPTCANTY